MIKSFKELSKKDVGIAGGKGASLGEMFNAGISVPPGFVILSKAFDRFIKETHLEAEIDAVLDKVNYDDIQTVEDASEKISALILGAKTPRDIEEAVMKFFRALKADFVAVRSSATSEDSSTAAWAGQLESYLNTRESDLLLNVKRCWASLFTPRAIVYRKEKELHTSRILVAVVVQKMVESECSGIAFSVHPITQDYNQMVIEAGFGLGEAIVSGQITPDSYVVEKKPRKIIDKKVAVQKRGLYRGQKGGNVWKSVSHGSRQVLSDDEILELSSIIDRIERHYRFPCDIEWAREKGRFFIVQSRPITTLSVSGKKKRKEPAKDEWEELIRSDLAAYNTSICMHSIQFSNKYVGGPKYKKLFLYIKDDMGYYYENFADHYKVGEYLLKTFLKDKQKLRDYVRSWKKDFSGLNRFYEGLKKVDLSQKSKLELAKLLHEVYSRAIRWHGVAYNVDAIDATLNPVLESLIREVFADEKKSRHSEIYNKITFPDTLSYVNRMHQEKLGIFIGLKERKIGMDSPELRRFVDDFYWIDFSMGPSKEYTLRELLHEYKDVDIKVVRHELDIVKKNTASALKEKEKILGEIALKKPVIRDYMDIFEEYAVFHDLRKEGQVKSWFFIRNIYQELARRCGIDEHLFYYFWPSEIESCVMKKKAFDVNLVVKRSKEYFYEYNADGRCKEYLADCARLERDKIINVDRNAKELSGIGTSQGRVIGPAKVCLGVKEALANVKKGDILVTGMTMPDFVPAMKTAAAIVTDEGGLTCHAAIISRELGKPCVVGTKNATKLIKDGDILEVNANHGVVKIVGKR